MLVSGPVRAVAVAGLSATAAALTAVASRSGIGLTWDSIAYAYAAQQVADGGTPTTMYGDPFTQYPPGLPLLVGTLARLWPVDADAVTIAAALGVALVAALVVATYGLSATALRNPTLALVPTALVAVATPVTMIYSRLWSESLACVLTTIVLLLLTRAVVRARLTWPTAVAVIALVALAPWVRYASAVLVGVAALGAGLALRRHGPARAVAGGVLVGLVSSLGTVAVVAHNLSVGSGPFGARTPPVGSVADYLVDTVATLGALVVPVPLADRLPALALGAGLVVAVLLSYGTIRVVRRRDAAMAVLVAFVAAYWLFILVSGRISFVEHMRYRMAAPALVPLAVLATYAGRELLKRTRGRHRAGYRLAGVVVAGLAVLAGPVAFAQSAAYAWTVGGHGHGYADRAVTSSPLAAAVGALPTTVHVVSNDPLEVYWAAGRVVDRFMPPPAEAPAAGTYLALFDDDISGTTRQLLDLDALGLPVDEVATYADGRLYVVR